MKLINLVSLAGVLVLLSSCASFYQFINVSPSDKLKSINFSESDYNQAFNFFYSDTLGDNYLRELRQQYKLDALSETGKTELDKIKIMVDWTNRQWKHNGSNNPSKSDALTILKEAAEGKMFRCVEYGIVASASLNSIGIKARVLGLKTRDVEKVRRGAGHVVTEVYSAVLKKWIFVDPQFNIMPVLNEMPLNAVEFQKAILKDRTNLKLVNLSGIIDKDYADSYINWIAKYLFYFDALFDQRISGDLNYHRVDGKTKLTLVPMGEKEPRVFQRSSKINYSHYTNSLKDFYRIP